MLPREVPCFSDEIGELSPTLQVKLLRLVQERTIRMVGGTEDLPVDVRIISATNRDLEKMVIEGMFREDLFYRLNVIHLDIPPLRQRREDIPKLAEHFLQKFRAKTGQGHSQDIGLCHGHPNELQLPG